MRRGHSHHFPLISMLLLFSSLSYGQAWSGILAPARATDWTQAGIPGGIPSGSWSSCVTSACNTAFSTPTVANINAAIASAPNNTVVRIPATTLTLTASICNNRGNVVLRGAGPTQTTIINNGFTVFAGSGCGGQGSNPGGLTATNLSTYAQGSTVLTVASTTGLSANQVVQIDQLNDTTNIVNVNGFSGSENAGRNVTSSLAGANNRAQLELVQIASVNAGANQITINAPGLSHTYTSGLSPQVFWWSTSGIGFNDGVENMTVDAGDGSAGHAATNLAVGFTFCNFCWAKNIAVIHAHRAGIYFMSSYRNEARDSYISESNTAGAPTEYGIECDTCSLAKIENNVLFGITAPILIETSYGVVVGYNYMLNTSSGNQFPYLDTHRAHNFLQLWEGNVTGTISGDFIWGSSSQTTMFRNRSSGNEPNKTNYQMAMIESAWNRYMNIVGNVLGDPTFHTVYECNSSNYGSVNNNFEYDLGFANYCGDVTNYDTVVESSLMRWGNWDAVTYCTNGGHGGTKCGSTGSNGIRYCTGSGAGNPACTASETASTGPTFPGLASPSTTFPASFYNGVTSAYPSCGTGLSFWKNPSTGTCPIYPPIGPDVTCSTNCISNTASHAAMIPAQLCYINSAKDGNGFLTAFDANACYANDPSSDPRQQPPTGLTAVVQ